MKMGNTVLASLALGFMGFHVIAIIAHGYSCGCKISYPAGEGTTLGIMINFASVLGVGLSFVLTFIMENEAYDPPVCPANDIPENPPNPVFYICMFLAIVGTVLAMIV